MPCLHVHLVLYSSSISIVPSVKGLTLEAMYSPLSLGLFAIACHLSTSLAEHIPPNHILWGPGGPPAATLLPRTPVEERDTVCTNTPEFRNCWQDGYSVATDFDKKWPTTGKTVTVGVLPI